MADALFEPRPSLSEPQRSDRVGDASFSVRKTRNPRSALEERITAIDHAVKEASRANAFLADRRASSSSGGPYECASQLSAESEWALAYHHQRERLRSHHASGVCSGIQMNSHRFPVVEERQPLT